MGGDGSMAWAYDHDGEVSVAASRTGSNLFMAGRSETAFTVAHFTTASSTPVWTFDALSAGYDAKGLDYPGKFDCSENGEVVAQAAEQGGKPAALIRSIILDPHFLDRTGRRASQNADQPRRNRRLLPRGQRRYPFRYSNL